MLRQFGIVVVLSVPQWYVLSQPYGCCCWLLCMVVVSHKIKSFYLERPVETWGRGHCPHQFTEVVYRSALHLVNIVQVLYIL